MSAIGFMYLYRKIFMIKDLSISHGEINFFITNKILKWRYFHCLFLQIIGKVTKKWSNYVFNVIWFGFTFVSAVKALFKGDLLKFD